MIRKPSGSFPRYFSSFPGIQYCYVDVKLVHVARYRTPNSLSVCREFKVVVSFTKQSTNTDEIPKCRNFYEIPKMFFFVSNIFSHILDLNKLSIFFLL